MSDSVIEEMRNFLARCRTAGLATVDAAGEPHAANIWYAEDDDLHLFFVSSRDTHHSQHILATGDVALTVYQEAEDPLHIHGLQIHGVCEPIDMEDGKPTEAWQYAWSLYSAKYPFVANNTMFRQAVESQSFWRVKPTWIRWMDNRKGFGFKVERDFEG